jgi:uncharacterized protein YbgA (DUF1722 family)
MSTINIQKQVFDKTTFPKVVDTQFHQLINSNQVAETPTFTLEDFFNLYEQLFYQIPKTGDSNSHQYILQKEADYLGVKINTDDIQALLAEITSLRQEVTTAQQTIQALSGTNGK